MPRKTGLLPKWLLLSTIIRMACIMFEHRMKVPPIETCRKVFVYVSFFLTCVRLLGVAKINPALYTLVALSYIVEVCWFAVALYFKCFSALRITFEIVMTLFSLSWMVFLYPYYLVKPEDQKKDK